MPENNTEITEINKLEEFEAFAGWYALPKSVREPKTQKEFAERIAVREATLTSWKKHPSFIKLRQQKIKEWGMDKTPEVLQAIYRRAIDKSTQDAKLWLKMIEDLKQEKISRSQFNQFNFFPANDKERREMQSFNERFRKFLGKYYAT